MKIVTLVFLTLCLNICAQVSIITNKKCPRNSITKTELTDLYTIAKTKLESDAYFTIVDSKCSETRDIFYKFIQIVPSRLKSEWKKMSLAGDLTLPKEFNNDTDIINEVLKTNGSIAFISSKNITSDVKVLLEIK